MTFRWNHFLNPDFFCIEKLFIKIVFNDTNQQSWDNTHKNSFDDYVQKILHNLLKWNFGYEYCMNSDRFVLTDKYQNLLK